MTEASHCNWSPVKLLIVSFLRHVFKLNHGLFIQFDEFGLLLLSLGLLASFGLVGSLTAEKCSFNKCRHRQLTFSDNATKGLNNFFKYDFDSVTS